MRKVGLWLVMLSILTLAGCAWTRSAGSGPETEAPSTDAVLRAPADESVTQALPAKAAFDPQARQIMQEASLIIGRLISMSGYEYAPREFFWLLMGYQEMQNAYMEQDLPLMQRLFREFAGRAETARHMTAQGKQSRLEELGKEVAIKRDEIRKQGQSELLEIFPAIYVVKNGDTLPSIAARHDIYNDSFMWPLIYKANRDQIKDPKLIYEGQDLKIPRDMTMEELIEARREAGAPAPETLPKDAFIPRRK